MALEDLGESLEGKGWWGVAIGAVVLAPMVIPAVARGLRPVAKEAVKGYLALSERAREMMAESGEQWQDLVAEAQSEYSHRHNNSEMMLLEADGEGAAGATGAHEEPAGAGEERSRRSHRAHKPEAGEGEPAAA